MQQTQAGEAVHMEVDETYFWWDLFLVVAPSVVADWRGAAYWGYNDAKDCHNEGEIYATDETHADGAKWQKRTELSTFVAQIQSDLTLN